MDEPLQNVFPDWAAQLPIDTEMPKLKRDWAGRYIVLKHILANGRTLFPAGLVMLVDRNYDGVHCKVISGCKVCGMGHLYMVIVREQDVALLGKDWRPHPSHVYRNQPIVGLPVLPLDTDFKRSYGRPGGEVFSFLQEP